MRFIENQRAFQHKVLEKNRRDGLRLEFDKLKYDLGMPEGKVRQQEILCRASGKLEMSLYRSRREVDKSAMRDPLIVPTLRSLMDEHRILNQEIEELESNLSLKKVPLSPKQKNKQHTEKNVSPRVEKGDTEDGFYPFRQNIQIPE